jgi:hypothetical protein
VSDTPLWVRDACRAWGAQKRRIWSGRDWHGNIDGYAQSLLGRIREEREGAGQGTPSQRWPEVFTGSGLEVQRSLVGMGEQRYAVIHLQYVWDPQWKVRSNRKADYVGVSRSEYFELAEKAETWIEAKLDRSCPDSQVIEIVTGIVRKALKTPDLSAINAQTRRNVPSLNLASLHRPILKRPA